MSLIDLDGTCHDRVPAPRETNYDRLFGTPERAFKTIQDICEENGGCAIGGESCPFYSIDACGHLESCVAYLREEAEDALHSQSD